MKGCLLLLLFVVVSCGTNSRRITDVDSSKNSCIEPPPEFTTTQLNASIDADVPDLEKVAKAGLSFDKKVERIREVLPGTATFEIVEYRLCIAVSQGRLSRADYAELITKTLPSAIEPSKVTLIVKITDEEGNPNPGAQVRIKGTNQAKSADFDGNVTFEVPYSKEGVELEVNLSGYSTVFRTVELTRKVQSIKITM